MFDIKRDEVQYEGKFLSLYKRDGWYQYLHNTKGNGQAVMVLAYDLRDPHNPKILGRYEHTPSHEQGYRPYETKLGEREVFLTSITGQMDKPGKSFEEVAIDELKEEAGIDANLEQLEDLGFVYPSKASDTLVKMFGFDASMSTLGKPEGDGSKGEEGSFSQWEDANFVIAKANCPMVGMAYLRLLNKKMSENYFNGAF